MFSQQFQQLCLHRLVNQLLCTGSQQLRQRIGNRVRIPVNVNTYSGRT
jgi:hypothetical protein